MGGDLTEREKRPGAGGEVRKKTRMGGRRAGGDDAAFVLVDAEAGEVGETTYEVESGRDEGHKVCRESKIVSKGKGLDTVEGGKSSEKRVVG